MCWKRVPQPKPPSVCFQGHLLLTDSHHKRFVENSLECNRGYHGLLLHFIVYIYANCYVKMYDVNIYST